MVSHTENPLVAVDQGLLRGVHEGGVLSWKGIPYAAPPIGEWRLRAPRAPESFDGVRDCSRFGPIAPQNEHGPLPIDPGLTIDEDCLTLNVFAPAADAGRPRPVMVWIHGGAYYLGSSGQRMFDPARLVERGDVVVVTFNYRLGALGFLDFSAFSTEEHPFDTNLGLRDQIAALIWVRDNIAAFGGDPGDVTLFGESAGGGSVTTLMTSPQAEGLFHRAIAESSPATSVYGSARAESIAESFLELLDIAPADAGRLRDLPVDVLTKACIELVQQVPARVPGTLAVAPTVDGDVVPHYPVAAFRKGLAHRIPLLIGTNKDEASMFRLMKSPLMPITPDAVHQMFVAIAADHPDLPADEEQEVAAAYPDYPMKRSAMEISRDAAFRMPTLWIAEAHSRVAPTWLYRFDYATPFLRAARIGATHGTEVPYVFGNFGVVPHDPTFKLGGHRTAGHVSERIQHRWLSFATEGTPDGTRAEIGWPRYDEADRTTLLIGRSDAVVDDPDRELRRAWGEEVIGFT
ncbi:carboxylesterase/lipase family protein [Rhodococcus koreensis]|uniref:Carboxylic ester hydrolase n=1 Tax=Rhodococcus koreensis TaxID=99653 RepID=A0A1H5AH97_9NOCA|nr:carboxylesterase/lipase family protein [Rhodococcus koreensis]QSE78850.1 carboxylesterase/lipase family protein [Rhodococcus koreensis]SED41753.1 para-nitrobenzyl esterase [Rhodococcus koreensis]